MKVDNLRDPSKDETILRFQIDGHEMRFDADTIIRNVMTTVIDQLAETYIEENEAMILAGLNQQALSNLLYIEIAKKAGGKFFKGN